MKEIEKVVAENITKLLKEKRITKLELAKIAGVSESTVGKWTLEKATPRMGAVQKISDYFNIPKAYILEEDRENQLVFAGRLDKLKGIDILFEAWKLMGNTAPKLIVCGTGPLEIWCKEFVKNNTVNIELKGFVPNHEVRRLIARSKALILPTQWYEGFPMSVVEAFSVGTPVICSDIGNVGSVVEEGVNGRKFRPDDINELIKAVKNQGIDFEQVIRNYNEKYSEAINYSILQKIYMRIIV